VTLAPAPSAAAIRALAAGEHASPHDVLGIHAATHGDRTGVVVRVLHPAAVGGEVLFSRRRPVPLAPLGEGGVFEAFVAGVRPTRPYRIRLRFPDGGAWEYDDPYRHQPTVGELDLHLFAEGTHRRLGEVFGAHARRSGDVAGVGFAVWAPNARRVSVVGDFCGWDGRVRPMRQLGSSGVFELFVPGLEPGALYKYEILTRDRARRLKCDPCGGAMECPPSTASRVPPEAPYAWGDDAWMGARPHRDPRREPMLIYEVHLGSWARVPEEGNRSLTYREIAPRLATHVLGLGFTHVELLPIMEHPFAGSWGYQVSGYYAPTARFGGPDDFRFFVDTLHQHGLGVILDWVPAHFPKDDFALARFDGTALYEHADVRRGEHPDWGTLIFDYGRREVRSFLVSSGLHWLREFHADGLRVDAVASMLYLDYSRPAGTWQPNEYGGRENLDAVALLRDLNAAVPIEAPGCITVAEESTAWPGVTRPVDQGGLGFGLKWNMGWMHDTLGYLAQDPVHRRYHHDVLTFAMIYEYSECFVNAISHDEVVHGKRALVDKMPGDPWQQLANLRLLLAYQATRPGKSLLFMGTELAQHREWNHDASLDWHLAGDPTRVALQRFMADLAALYRAAPCLWRCDPDPEGFAWIDCNDRENSIIAYERRAGDSRLTVVLNFTPVPREDYRIGAPAPGRWVRRLSSDDAVYGGSGWSTPETLEAEPTPAHGRPHSLRLRVPPLGALVLAPEGTS
jgi:1,4-alpha-glucan branching enzyme